MDADKLVSLYVDSPRWNPLIQPDDFLVAVGAKQSNSVYHVAEVKHKDCGNGMMRNYVKVFRSDLVSALRRDPSQRLIPLTWYKR